VACDGASDTGNIPVIKKSVERLGFNFSDIKILLGNHAHGDHQEGDAMVKEMTGAQVMALAEDVPALQAIKPGGKKHPIDKILHDGEPVTLGEATVVAHLTAGHTRGCTTWAMKVQDGGKTCNVVFGGSLRSPETLTPEVVDEMNRSFKVALSALRRSSRRSPGRIQVSRKVRKAANKRPQSLH